MEGIAGKVAIVTGAGSGIGSGTALKLAAAGCRVMLTDVAEEAGRRVPEQIMFMSIDNTLADRCGKPLSAVSMPFEELGRCAATQALGPAAQTPFHAHIRLKPTLVERNEGT